MAETASVQAKQVAAPQQGTAATEKFILLPILVLMLAQMGTVGENGAMSIAASALTTQLGATMSDIQLANMIYPLIAGAVMVVGGMLGTIIGWKKNLRIGLFLAAVGEIVAAVSPDIAVFTWGGRVLTGLGASLLVPSLLGMVPTIYKSGKNRALAFGCIGAAMGLANVMPLILGAIMDVAGFRITFGILGAYFFAVFAVSFAMPKVEQTGGKLKLDTKGAFLAVVGLFLFLFGVSRISIWGLWMALPTSPFSFFSISPAPIFAILGIIVLIVLFQVEKKVEDKNGCALIPRSFYQTPQVLAGLATCAAIFVFNGAMVILLLPYVQLVAGWSALLAGLATVAYGIPMFLLALGQPKLMPNANLRRVVQVGYLLAVVGTIVLIFSITVDGVSAFVWLGVALAGGASGLMSAQASNVVALAVNDRDAAQSGGVQATARNVGQAVAIAVLGTMLLFSISGGVSGAAAASPEITPQVKSAIAERTFTLTSDANFEASIADISMTDAEKSELVAINAENRTTSTQMALGVTAVILLLGLITTRWITVFKKDEEALASHPCGNEAPVK